MQVTDEEYAIIKKRFQAKAANEINYVEFDHVLRHYSGDHEPFWDEGLTLIVIATGCLEKFILHARTY